MNNNETKIKIPDGNKFYLKPQEAFVINKFLPFGIKLEKNALDSEYFEAQKMIAKKRLRSSKRQNKNKRKANKKAIERESDSESAYEQEEEEESEEVDDNDTESYVPEELYISPNQPKSKKSERKSKRKSTIKTKLTRALTQKQPKKNQTNEIKQPISQQQQQPTNNIKQRPNQQQQKSLIIQPQNKETKPSSSNALLKEKKRIKQQKLTPKLKLFSHHEKKEKIYLVNVKCSKGFERLLENSLSALFYDSKHPDCPSLKSIEHKLMKKEYKTIYDFGYDLRKIWSFYFKYYASSPQYYQLTYNMSEYSENVITELEEMTHVPLNQEAKRIECLSMEEKEELGENINLLNQDDLKKLLLLFDHTMMKKDGNKKLFEFDINSLPNETQMKMYRFVKRCIHNQATGKKDYDQEEIIEMERIQKLKNDLGILNESNNAD